MSGNIRRNWALIAFIAVAALGVIYFAAFDRPISAKLSGIEAEKEIISQQTAEAEAALEEYTKMKNELERIDSLPDGSAAFMPDYDNSSALIYYFGRVFEDSKPELTFEAPKTEGNVASRRVNFRFAAKDYSAAKNTLRLLDSSGFLSRMPDLSIVPEGGDLENGSLRVSGSIVFYELVR